MKQIIAVKSGEHKSIVFYSDYTYRIMYVDKDEYGRWAIDSTYLLYWNNGVYHQSSTTVDEFNQLRAAYQFDKELEELLK